MRFELRDQSVAQDPGLYYRELREQCPVAHVDDYDGFWILSRYDDVLAAARNVGVFSSADGVTIPKLPIPAQICLEQDDPEHAKYRKPMQQWLSPARMAAMEDQIRAVVTRLIDGVIDRGEADLAAELCDPIPAVVMAIVMGLPETDWPIFRERLGRCLGLSASEDETGAAIAAFELVQYLADSLADRRANPRNDLLTEIATLVVEGEPISEEQAVSMSFLMLGAGHETTAGALSGLIYYLARDADVQERLRADPTLHVGATEEALRLVAPLPGMGRTLLADATVGDVTIPAGERVMLLYGAANRDPDAFEDPEEFRPSRDNNRHLSFSNGIHRCVGAPLARLEMRVMLDELLKRLPPFRLAEPEAAEARYGTSRGYKRLVIAWS